jgi:hypothetical protein
MRSRNLRRLEGLTMLGRGVTMTRRVGSAERFNITIENSNEINWKCVFSTYNGLRDTDGSVCPSPMVNTWKEFTFSMRIRAVLSIEHLQRTELSL